MAAPRLRDCFALAAVWPCLALAQPAAAQDTLGRLQYSASCAQCHGPQGGGDGPLAGFLTTPPPALTGLQRDNGGVFPFARVYAVIENGGGVDAHGGSEMPAWSEQLVIEAYLREGVVVAPDEREAFVRRRILALIDHLAQLQEP